MGSARLIESALRQVNSNYTIEDHVDPHAGIGLLAYIADDNGKMSKKDSDYFLIFKLEGKVSIITRTQYFSAGRVLDIEVVHKALGEKYGQSPVNRSIDYDESDRDPHAERTFFSWEYNHEGHSANNEGDYCHGALGRKTGLIKTELVYGYPNALSYQSKDECDVSIDTVISYPSGKRQVTELMVTVADESAYARFEAEKKRQNELELERSKYNVPDL